MDQKYEKYNKRGLKKNNDLFYLKTACFKNTFSTKKTSRGHSCI